MPPVHTPMSPCLVHSPGSAQYGHRERWGGQQGEGGERCGEWRVGDRREGERGLGGTVSGSHVLLTAFHTFLPPVAGVTAVMVTPGLLSRGAESWWVSRDSHGGTARATGGRPGPRGDGPGHGGTARATGGPEGHGGTAGATGGPEGHGGQHKGRCS